MWCSKTVLWSLLVAASLAVALMILNSAATMTGLIRSSQQQQQQRSLQGRRGSVVVKTTSDNAKYELRPLGLLNATRGKSTKLQPVRAASVVAQTTNGTGITNSSRIAVALERAMARKKNGDAPSKDMSPSSTREASPTQPSVQLPVSSISKNNSQTSVSVDIASSMSSTMVASLSTANATSVGYLPLLPWEKESIETRRCLPPYTLPTQPNYTTTKRRAAAPSLDYCCIGSFSQRGKVKYVPKSCDLTAAVYQRHEQAALEAWSRIPIFPSRNTASEQQQQHLDCDVCQIINVLLDFNWTMAFLGDSITGQSFMGLECELRRRGYSVDRRPIDYRLVDPNKWRHILYGLQEVHELHVQKRPIASPDYQPATATSDDQSSTTTAILRYYRVYRPSRNLTEINEIRALNDVLIFDHGLHYTPLDVKVFEQNMTQLVHALMSQDDDIVQKKAWKLLAWRETSAQHYESSVAGHYNSNSKRCVAMNYSHTSDSHGQSDREKLYYPRTASMKRILAEYATATAKASHDAAVATAGTTVVRILPFWNYTQPLFDLHPGKDCTHFCATPSFWLYLWRHLRNAIDETAAATEAAVAA